MLTKAVVFLFCTIGVTGLILTAMPGQFQALRTDTTQNVQVARYFDLHNLTVYGNQKTGNMTGPGWSKTDIPSGAGADDWIEMYWHTAASFPEDHPEYLNIVHAHGIWYGRTGHDISFYHDGVLIQHSWFMGFGGSYPTKEDLTAYWDSSLNGTYFDLQCNEVTANILYQTNYSTIAEGWDNDYLGWSLTYTANLTSTGLSVWTIIGTLFAFQAPTLGMPTIAEDIIGGAISCAMWALVIVVAYKVLAGLIPWLSGGSGD